MTQQDTTTLADGILSERTGDPATKRRFPAWLLVAASMFAIAWGGNEFTPLLVSYKGEGMDPVTVDFLLFAYVVGIVPALAISAPLSDRIGRRPVFLPAPWIGIIGSTLMLFGGDNAALLSTGRVLTGISLGIAMAVGGSWLKEASSAPFDSTGDSMAGSRRQGLALTSGFAIGAAVAGVLAEWGPWAHVLPYAVHIVLSVVLGIALISAPETLGADLLPAGEDPTTPEAEEEAIEAADEELESAPSMWSMVRTPRFFFLAVLLAPWVFGAAGVAYAVLPAVLAPSVSAAPVGFSALLCVLTLGSGFLVQQFVRRFVVPGTIVLGVLAYSFIIAGMLLAALTVSVTGIAPLAMVLALVSAIVLGLAYGLALQTGLLEITDVARRGGLAAYTALFYALAYLGFAFPMILSKLSDAIPYAVMLTTGAVIAAVSFAAMLAAARKRRSGSVPVPESESDCGAASARR